MLGIFIGAAASAYLAFIVQKPFFEATALLIPIEQGHVGGQLSGTAAALLGGKNNGGGSDVDLYQSLLTSRTVMHKTLMSVFLDLRDTATLREKPLYRILGVDTSKNIVMENVLNALSGSIVVGAKDSRESAILKVKGQAAYPWLAQQLTDIVLNNGQEELRRVRTERYDAIMGRLAIAVNIAKLEWDTSARKVAYFRDRNRSISLPDQALEVSRLELDKQAKEQKYFLARRELEQQQMDREKATPPMLILDSANLPAKKSGPKRGMILVIGLIAGFVCGSAYVIVEKMLFGKEH